MACSPQTAAAIADLLHQCLPMPEVRAIGLDHSGDAPAARVWVTRFAAPVQLLLDQLQDTYRELAIIAMRLPSGAGDRPPAGPDEIVFVRDD